MARRILSLALAAGLLAAAPAGAQDTKVVPTAREQITLSYAPLVRRVAPAVVNIYTKRVVQARVSPLLDDPFFRRFFGDNFTMGAPRQRVQASLGSGVIVRPDGLIVTNNHVIKDSDEITVALADRREFPAKVVIADERTDLAVLRIAAGTEKLPYLDIRDSDELEVGDLVLAIGDPFGVGQTVTSGIVSAVARTAVGVNDYSFFIQTDAAINPGNSGGALVSMDGRLVGINTAIYSQTGGSVGIGFAIPSNMVKTYVDAAQNGGKVVRPWLGASGQTVTSELAQSLRLARPEGVVLNQVAAGSPAAQSGLRAGDVITAVNGHPIDGPAALRFRLGTLPIGGTAQLGIIRKGESQQVPVRLQPPPEDPPRDVTLLQGRNPLAGGRVANLNPALIEELGFEGAAQGVVVLEVLGNSLAARFGLQPGDLVLRVNEADIRTVRDLVAALERPARGWVLTIKRGEQVLTAQVGG
jgi:serine protease Do